MQDTITPAEMRALEQAAIESGVVRGLDLMERAGRGVVEAIEATWPPADGLPQSAAILCGPGNNGGDGFVVARLLQAKGWQVCVFLLGPANALTGDARVNHDRWLSQGSVAPLSLDAVGAQPYTIYVDALFGTGLARPLTAIAADVMAWLAEGAGDRFRDRIVCVDAPSGLDMRTGHILGETGGLANARDAFARLTVTFHRAKPGHVLNDGPRLCGTVVVKDIGL